MCAENNILATSSQTQELRKQDYFSNIAFVLHLEMDFSVTKDYFKPLYDKMIHHQFCNVKWIY